MSELDAHAWIDVTVKLPPPGLRVRVWLRDPDGGNGHETHGYHDGGWIVAHYVRYVQVSHWQPLDEGPV